MMFATYVLRYIAFSGYYWKPTMENWSRIASGRPTSLCGLPKKWVDETGTVRQMEYWLKPYPAGHPINHIPHLAVCGKVLGIMEGAKRMIGMDKEGNLTAYHIT